MDDLIAVAEALHRALAATAGFRVVGVAGSQADVSRLLLAGTAPDVILVHEHFSRSAGTLSEQILAHHPEIPVVAMVSDGNDENLYTTVSAGVSGLVMLRLDGFEALVTTLSRAATGEVLLSSTVLRRIIQRQRMQLTRDRQRGDVLRRLTRRELEVLELVTHGLDNRTIAARMHVSVTTVRSHVQRVLSKLEVHSKLEATVLANQYDLVRAAEGG
ncbi:MAG TPA: response regulator transcription factor [Candidatus Dormibacteraeota bacterium]